MAGASTVRAIGGGGVTQAGCTSCSSGGGRSAIRFDVHGHDVVTAGGGYVEQRAWAQSVKACWLSVL